MEPSRIAGEIKRHRSTIARELKRNAGQCGFIPVQADDKACARQTGRRNARQFSTLQWELVRAYLRLSLSPEQVAGRRHREKALFISHENIYQHVYQTNAKAVIWCVICAARDVHHGILGPMPKGGYK